MVKIDDYKNHVPVQWCPGCPNFGILSALKAALTTLEKQPHACCLVSGIGQAAKLPHYLNCNFFNGLHGRAIPAALGIHVANPHLTTIVVTGEGDCYGEGGNHFLHALRRNPDITVVVHNNGFYALTKGQASPTTTIGEKRSLQIHGNGGKDRYRHSLPRSTAQSFRRPVPQRDYRSALCDVKTDFSGKNFGPYVRPESAIASGGIDFVLSPEDIAQEIARIAHAVLRDK